MNVKLTQMLGETIDEGTSGGYVSIQQRGNDKRYQKHPAKASPKNSATLIPIGLGFLYFSREEHHANCH